jgi:hypothetical protein
VNITMPTASSSVFLVGRLSRSAAMFVRWKAIKYRGVWEEVEGIQPERSVKLTDGHYILQVSLVADP